MAHGLLAQEKKTKKYKTQYKEPRTVCQFIHINIFFSFAASMLTQVYPTRCVFFFVFVFCFLSTCAHDEIVCLRRPRSNRHPKVAYIGTQSGQVGKMSQASLRIKVYRTRAPWHFLLFFLTFPLIPNLHRVTKCASKCTKKPRDTRNGGYINFHFAQIRKFASSAQFASPLPPWRNTSG